MYKNDTFNLSEILLFSKENETELYKLQGDNEMSYEKLDKLGLFKKGYEIIYKHHWEFAYPKLLPARNSSELPEFRIHNKIFYLNAIEVAASCMEMSMISGLNIVKIILNENNFKYDSCVLLGNKCNKKNVNYKDDI
jgi:hypothetical protein